MRAPISLVLPLFLLASNFAFSENPAPQQSIASTEAESLKHGLTLYRTGRFDDAIVSYQSALSQNPKSGQAYAGLVRCYLKQEKIQEAAATVKGASEIVPTSSALQVAAGELLFRQGDIAGAEKQFVAVINSGAVEPRAYLGLERISRAISMYKRAKRMIDTAHDLDPQDPEISRVWLSTLNRADRRKELERYLAQQTNDDQETLEALQRSLELLKDEEKEPAKRCRLANDLSSSESSLEAILNGPNHLVGYGLNVKLNGHGSRLLVDTGASGVVLGRRAAEKAGITALVSSKLYGIGDKGAVNSFFGYADSIRVGDLEFRDCLVEVSEKKNAMDIDGLIGTDVFDDFLITLDMPNMRLRLKTLPPRAGEAAKPKGLKTATPTVAQDTPDLNSAIAAQKNADPARTVSTQPPALSGPQDRYIAPEMESFSRVFRFGHDLLIPTMLGDKPPKLFLIDTGAVGNLVSPAAAREVTKVSRDETIEIRGLNGKVEKVYRADRATLTFSRFKQQNQDIVAFDLSGISKNLGTEVSGALGFPILRLLEITIDYRDGLVGFNYDPKRWPRP